MFDVTDQEEQEAATGPLVTDLAKHNDDFAGEDQVDVVLIPESAASNTSSTGDAQQGDGESGDLRAALLLREKYMDASNQNFHKATRKYIHPPTAEELAERTVLQPCLDKRHKAEG